MAVKGLIHYALEVPDPEVGAAFYRDFGLRSAEGGSKALRLEAGRGAGGLLLFEGPKKRLHHVAFAAPGDHFEAVRAALKRGGIAEIEPPEEAPQTGIWLRDPDGNLINIRREERTAIAAEPPLPYNGPGNATRRGARGLPTFERAEPRRLGHVLFFTPDPDASERFYTGVLGFKVSDRVPGLLSFLRCATDHHTLAFGKSSHRGFHHASYEVGSFDEVGMGGMWMRERGWEPAPGRQWGAGAPRDRQQRLLLHQGSLGQLRRVLLRHRLHSRRRGVGGARVGPEIRALLLGAGRAWGFHREQGRPGGVGRGPGMVCALPARQSNRSPMSLQGVAEIGFSARCRAQPLPLIPSRKGRGDWSHRPSPPDQVRGKL